jgi:hypothetical protein
LLPLLEHDDIVIDGGNSLFTDTERRDAWLTPLGLRFIGAGVSGGEEGARKGPAIMPGGPASSWAVMRPIFEAIAARVDGQPCVIHIGPGGAGHFVKMVHNGIEYGDMQLIAEAYALLRAAGLSNDAMADVFERWNEGELQSYLVEITVPDATWAARETLEVRRLDPTWAAIPAGSGSVKPGSEWIKAGTSALLMVPSVIVPEESAVLVNPKHPDAAALTARVVRLFEYNRLFRPG